MRVPFPPESSFPPSRLSLYPSARGKTMYVGQRHCMGVSMDFLDNSFGSQTFICIYLNLEEIRLFEFPKCVTK